MDVSVYCTQFQYDPQTIRVLFINLIQYRPRLANKGTVTGYFLSL